MGCINKEHSGHCSLCSKRGECKLEKIFVDANFFLCQPKLEEFSGQCQEFLRRHRKNHRISTTHEILGEVYKKLNILISEGEAEENILTWIKNSADIISKINMVEVPIFNKKFEEILEVVHSNGTHSGVRDQMMIASTIFYQMPIITFDKGIIESRDSLGKNKFDGILGCSKGLNVREITE